MNKENLFKLLILLPYIWLSSGLLILPNGDKTMIAMIVIAIAATLIHRGFAPIKENLKNDKTLWVLLAFTGYALFSHAYHGISSREIRALLGASLFLVCFPRELLTQRVLLGLTLLASSLCLVYVCYYNLYLNDARRNWPINAIPFATMCATFGIIAITQLSRTASLSVKSQATLALLFSLTAIILTETRGIWLGFSTAAICIFLIKLKRNGCNWRYIITGVLTFIILCIAVKPQIEQRIEKTQEEVEAITSGNLSTSIGLRLQMWRISPDMLENNYILGLGNNHKLRFSELYKEKAIATGLYRFKPSHYHNQYLDKLIKNGLIGLLFLLALLAFPLAQSKRLATERKYQLIGISCLFAIAALTDVPFNHGQTLIIYLLLVCGLANHQNISKKNDC
ncbi:O-antigen ligase family protein [Photobacterium makurazakiensis]|uniref:O-antigen ligase family protein n=1 Tax=Photobacterium makurazakiensis TaxID=2910234 RepID=UPI003D0DC30F